MPEDQGATGCDDIPGTPPATRAATACRGSCARVTYLRPPLGEAPAPARTAAAGELPAPARTAAAGEPPDPIRTAARPEGARPRPQLPTTDRYQGAASSTHASGDGSTAHPATCQTSSLRYQ
ncbi:hypothetical protein GCM10010293_52920 [Streptomyces griseoflavus]|nr:hypothetical protein GCM10010293_52920 [Streptomyces griseoflavus]